MPRGFYRREFVCVSEIRGLRKGFLLHSVTVTDLFWSHEKSLLI